MSQSVLELKKVTKVYPNGVVANRNVDFSLNEGEIHAIVGENGAGKSTLMKILFGMEQPNDGKMYFRGEEIVIHSPQHAIELGIGMVHQHFMLVPSFTVAQNMLLGMEPTKRTKIDIDKSVEITQKISDKYNLKVDPNMKVENLSVGMKQKVEILKALLRGAKILILDEPTAVLTPQETEELFEQLITLKNEGHTIIFISHKLKEVKKISDRITIIRKGETQGVFLTSDVDEKEISRLMVGRDVILKYDKEPIKAGTNVLEVKGVSLKGKSEKLILDDVNFVVRKGEILGVAGVEGNGQKELVELITGMRKLKQGAIRFNGESVSEMSVLELRGKGMSYIPEDRMTQGAVKDANISENLIANKMKSDEIIKHGFLNLKNIRKMSNKLVEDYAVRCASIDQNVGMLSGGNIQKVVVARECNVEPQLLIAEQPTRGVDVGAARLIHEQLIRLRDDQTGILLLSADLNEVLELSDALIVMYEGEIVGYFSDPSQLSEEELGLYMLGIQKQSKDEIRRVVHE